MTVRIYVRASTKDQDAKRALSDLINFSQSYDDSHVEYVEHFSGTVNTPVLTQHHCRIIKPPVCTQQVSYH